jgi:cysteine desulfurase
MYANNETGVVHPVSTIGLLAKKLGVLFFSDATQAIGKIPVNVVTDHIDIMSFSAHKCYGPKGIGALYVRRKNPRVSLLPQLHGGKQENGLRSGTLNVPGIVGLGKAAEMAFHQLSFNYAYTKGLRNHLEQQLLMIPEVNVNGSLTSRLPTVSNLCFRFTQGQLLLIAINKQLAVSSGAACSTANADPSHVLMAMGLGKAAAKASIRFSLGKYTTREEIDFSIQCITDAVLELRRYVAIDVSKEKESADWLHSFNRNS